MVIIKSDIGGFPIAAIGGAPWRRIESSKFPENNLGCLFTHRKENNGGIIDEDQHEAGSQRDHHSRDAGCDVAQFCHGRKQQEVYRIRHKFSVIYQSLFEFLYVYAKRMIFFLYQQVLFLFIVLTQTSKHKT